MTTSNISLEKIDANPWQTRHNDPDPEYIAELAGDIEKRGLLQIPIGRISQNGKSMDDPETRIQLAFGHNRLAAYIHLANNYPGGGVNSPWARMPVDIRTLTDEEMADMAWAENERRRDHTPIDRALAIQQRMDDFGYSHAQVAEHLGISRPVVSNSLRLLKLPEEYMDKLRSGQVSERQALSILPLFDLPDSILDQAENHYNQDTRPSAILDDLDEGISSGEIRRRINDITSRYAESLHEASWDLEEVFEVQGDATSLIVSADCKSCNARIKERNLCTNLGCYREKEQIWERSYILEASEASGIEPLAANLSRYDVTTFSKWSDEDRLPTIRSSGCENLRLSYNPRIYEYEKGFENRLDDLDFPHAELVCCKRSGWCSCLKGLRYQEQMAGANGSDPDDEEVLEERMAHVSSVDNREEPPTAEELQELARQARSERLQAWRMTQEIVRIAGARIASGFQYNILGLWKLLGKNIHYKFGPDQTEGMEHDDYLLILGEYIAKQELPYDTGDVDRVLEKINWALKYAGLDPIELEEVES